MLKLLHIENVAVVEKADIEFGAGLNVLTGETGAGKSIIIDAMGAALGGRTSRELVRTGADSAMVTAVFSGENAGEWCEENGIELSDGELFITRRITADGKNTCRVSGCPVSVAQLRDLGALLLNIHGQNDGQRLLDERFHRDYLDKFGRLEEELASYSRLYGAYRKTLDEIERLTMDESEKERRTDTLKFQIAELERANITLGETVEKTARRDLLKNSGKLTNAISGAFYALYGGDSSDGALSLIGEAESSLGSAARYSEDLRALGTRVTELRYAAQDIAEELRDLKDSLDFSPEEMDALESRLDQLRRLSRKYGGSEEDMLAFLDRCREDLDKIEYSGELLGKLKARLEGERAAAEKAAEALSQKRKAAARELEGRIQSELSHLSMKGVQFEVDFSKPAGGITAEGCDEVSFLMSANAGEKVGKISRIASGGELARIMLAMKNVLSEADNIGTMVFDEVDTGVSGIAAQRVGEKLADLASRKQVICVTHLPQIAAMADEHFCIEKTQKSDRTYTYVNRLNADGRKRELARLTGGEVITETTLLSASEQLSAAADYKKHAKEG